VADFTGTPGFLVVYGYDGLVAQLPPSRVRQVNYPYAGLLKLGTVDYVSAANVSGCEKCHTVPYLKHGNILGQVDNVATDLITCKACHLDNGDGGHQVWQLLVDDTVKAGDYWALNPGGVEEEMTLAELAKYAYKTRLMNDVHMSHAMEFEYPQSMANCNTCHAGKLNAIFADANFNFETCKSCHAVTGSPQAEKPQPALKDMMNSFHFTAGTDNVNATHVDCFDCHSFTDFHTGYDKVIYATDNGVKYSDVIKVTIDNASFDNNSMLTIEFSAAGTAGGLDSADIAPTVLVGLYGYDTKDYIAGPHERTFDDNGDGVANSSDSRNLEYAVGATHPRFTTDNTTPAGSWKVTANLSHWAGMISAGSVKRVEIGVMPALKNPGNDNALVALDAPSRTFNLGSKTFTDSFYPAIVKVATGCNNCHDALATTFHSADRGGNIVVCRLCHITKNGGSHLEMQSRSIDSYVHAIHTFQDFDIGDIDFDNTVATMYHEIKIESHYPTFDTTNCTSCHNAGTFNVPDQAKSLAGILSGSDTVAGRALNGVPAYVTGPASRACGACHRAELIKEDAAGEFAAFNQHTQDGGYLLVPGDIPTLIGAINAVMPMFNDDVIVVLP
jgi:OmcA/MtrC family decaheme c-type cytochrome